MKLNMKLREVQSGGSREFKSSRLRKTCGKMATSFHTNLTFIFNQNTYFQSSKNLSTEKRVALLEFYSQTSLCRYRYFLRGIYYPLISLI